MNKLIKFLIVLFATSLVYFVVIYFIILSSPAYRPDSPELLAVTLFSGLFIVVGEYFFIFQKGKIPTYKGDAEIIQYRFSVMGMPFAKDKEIENVEGNPESVKTTGSCLVFLGLFILIFIIVIAWGSKS